MPRRIILFSFLLITILAGCNMPQPVVKTGPQLGSPEPFGTTAQGFPSTAIISASPALPASTQSPNLQNNETNTPSVTSAPGSEAATPVPGSASPSLGVVGNPTRFIVQSGTPANTANFIDPGAACNWLGVGGQVFGLNSQPIAGLVVELGGIYNGKALSQRTSTGSSPAVGPGGFSFFIGNRPLQTRVALWIQILDANNVPQSGRIYFDTYSDCDHNLVLINFTEISTPIYKTLFLPFIGKQRLYYYFPFVSKP